MFAVNIISRSLVILVGVGIAFGFPPFDAAPSPFHEIFGSVVCLFGAYRLTTFWTNYSTLDVGHRSMKHRFFSILGLAAIVAGACAPASEEQTGSPEDYETAIRGSVEIFVDEEVIDLLGQAKDLYDAANPEARVTLRPGSALEIADDIIEHRIRGAVLARDWLPGEDSTVRSDRGEDGFPTTEIAKDALVFYASPSFPLDTLSADDIGTWLNGGVVSQDVYPGLTTAPVFVVPGVASSVYGNVMLQITYGAEPAAGSVASLPTRDSVRAAVLADNRLIGVGYLSQFVNDSAVKMLRLGFTDSTGTWIRPKPVHAAYLIMGKYPFPVPISIILKDRASQYSLPSGFALFMARDGDAQRTFFDQGVEPGYARIELTLPE